MSKRKCLNINDKLKVLESIDKGCKKKDVAEKFGIPPSSLSTIIKNRDSILKSSDNAGRERKRVKMCVFEEVDQAVLKWVHVVRNKNVPLSSSLVKQQALKFAQSLGHLNFQASNGWLEKFKKGTVLLKKLLVEKARMLMKQTAMVGGIKH